MADSHVLHAVTQREMTACRYNTYRFGGSKKLVLSTASWLGGRNTFMGVAYIVVGATSVLFSLLFFVVQSVIPRTQGDASRLSFAKAGSLQPR